MRQERLCQLLDAGTAVIHCPCPPRSSTKMPGFGADSEQQLRHACDRCHSQKLRCPRSVDPEKNNPDEPCSRCRKAGLVCTVSLRGKAGRPAKVDKKRERAASVRPAVLSRTSTSSYRSRSPESEFPLYDATAALSSFPRETDQPWEQHEGVDAVEDHLITAVLDLAPRQTVATPPPTISDEVGMEHPPSPPPTHASDRLVTSETVSSPSMFRIWTGRQAVDHSLTTYLC
jgi:hypothetical protein